MKVLWKIKMLDGSIKEVSTTESDRPTPGDGKIIDGLPVTIGSNVTTPTTKKQTGYDLVAAAEEQTI